MKTKLVRQLALCAVAAVSAGLIGGAVVVRATDAWGGSGTVGTVTFLKGKAHKSRPGRDDWKPLRQKARLYQGDRLKTLDDSRLEATLNDGSKLRLAENSTLNLSKVSVGKRRKAKKGVSLKLTVGRMWASVTRLFGTDSKFEVTTDNAVAGVRGTRFTAARDENGETTVKVYSGKVLVSNKPIYAVEGHTKANRVEVAGPQEVSKNQWEELVAGAMQVVKVSSSGDMSPPATFAMADPKEDDWEQWNTERDKLAGLAEEE